MTDAQTTSKGPAGKSRLGKVRSASGDKTVSVVSENLVRHRRYGRYVRRRTTVAVHDPKRLAQVGDVVEIAPCRPISKTKAWRLVRVVRRPAISQAETAEADKG